MRRSDSVKRIVSLMIVLCLLAGACACSRQKNGAGTRSENGSDLQNKNAIQNSSDSGNLIVNENKTDEENDIKENDAGEENGADEVSKETQEHILIAYFSWADNTVVEDEEAAIKSALSHYESIGDADNYDDIDLVSSASIIAPGNTAKLAEWIYEYVGGDLFPIVVTDLYPDNYDECLDRAADEKADNARPELAAHIDNMEDYDLIFLGFPNWWYTAPMAIFSFLEEYDFSGKTVVPFCAHGTGGVAASIKDIKAELPDTAKILDYFDVYRADINSAQADIEEWLAKLGFSRKEETQMSENNTERKLKLTVDGQVIDITLYDTPAANALYEMLPLELEFEDFNGIEKISYLTEKLPTDGEPDGCDPDVGDFCLYAPWGNLSIFYQDFRYSDSLIMLGHVDSGMDIISGKNNNFSATLEAAETVRK